MPVSLTRSLSPKKTRSETLKRTFVTNLILLVGLNLLVKPFYLLVVETEIQNRVGAETFGGYFALINFSFILNILLDLGTTNWNTRHTARHETITAKQFSGMLTLRLLLALAYVICAMTIGLLLHYSAWQLFILFVLGINQVLASTVLYLRSYLTGLHLFRHDSVISVLDRLLLVFMMSALLWGSFGTFRIEWLVWGQTIAYGITCLVALAMVITRSGAIKMSFDRNFLRGVLKESMPFAWLILLSMIACRVDGLLLERISGGREAGIYAMGFRFFDAVNMFAYLFAVLLLPLFSRMLKKEQDVSALVHLGFKILFSGTFIIAVFSWFFGDHILAMVYDNNIGEASEVFSWLMLSAFFFAMQYVFGTLITAGGNMRLMIYIALGSMVYNIVLNLFYIPHMGALGAARVSCFTQFIVLAAQVGVVMHRFAITGVKQLAIRTLVFALVCVGVGLFFSRQTIIMLTPAYSSGLFLLLALAAALTTRMLDIRRFVELLRTRE